MEKTETKHAVQKVGINRSTLQTPGDAAQAPLLIVERRDGCAARQRTLVFRSPESWRALMRIAVEGFLHVCGAIPHPVCEGRVSPLGDGVLPGSEGPIEVRRELVECELTLRDVRLG